MNAKFKLLLNMFILTAIANSGVAIAGDELKIITPGRESLSYRVNRSTLGLSSSVTTVDTRAIVDDIRGGSIEAYLNSNEFESNLFDVVPFVEGRPDPKALSELKDSLRSRHEAYHNEAAQDLSQALAVQYGCLTQGRPLAQDIVQCPQALFPAASQAMSNFLGPNLKLSDQAKQIPDFNILTRREKEIEQRVLSLQINLPHFLGMSGINNNCDPETRLRNIGPCTFSRMMTWSEKVVRATGIYGMVCRYKDEALTEIRSCVVFGGKRTEVDVYPFQF